MVLTELNKIAIWRPINTPGLNVKPMTNYLYLSKGARKIADVFRYAKNYEIDDKLFSLLIVTDKQDDEKVEAFLDSIAPTTPLDYCDGSLHKTDKQMK